MSSTTCLPSSINKQFSRQGAERISPPLSAFMPSRHRCPLCRPCRLIGYYLSGVHSVLSDIKRNSSNLFSGGFLVFKKIVLLAVIVIAVGSLTAQDSAPQSPLVDRVGNTGFLQLEAASFNDLT